MFLRESEFADNRAFLETVKELLPNAETGLLKKGGFEEFLTAVAYENNNILAIMEATAAMVPYSCINALRDGLKQANRYNHFLERVIPVLVVDRELAHSINFQTDQKPPEGPQAVMKKGKTLGAIVIPVTPQTLRTKLAHALQEIINGTVPQQTESS